MIEISINAFGHEWEKLNHVTQKGQQRSIRQGKRYSLNTIHIYERYRHMLQCPVKYDQIKIIHCNAFGKQFKNLTDGSIHDIIDPPEGYTQERGEWVMGVSEPVLVLFSEFIYFKKGGKP